MSNNIMKLKKNKSLAFSLSVFALATCFVLIGTSACGSENTNTYGGIYAEDGAELDQVVDLESNVDTSTMDTDLGEIDADGINYFDASLNTDFGVSADLPMAGSLRAMYDAVNYIVIGSFGVLEETVNSARNWRNPLEEDPDSYHRALIYNFQVQSVLKGSIGNDTIRVAVPHFRRHSGEINNAIFNVYGEIVRAATEFDPWEIDIMFSNYIEPNPDELVMLFLDYVNIFDSYRLGIEPHRIILEEDGTVRLRSNFTTPLEEREAIAVNHGESDSGRPITFRHGSLLTVLIPDTITGMTHEELVEEIESFEGIRPRHAVSIQSGGAGTSASPAIAEPGQLITINAGTAPVGYTFSGWTSAQNIALADANAAVTTFTMLSEPVSVTANWQADAAVDYTMELELQILSEHLIGYEHDPASAHFLVHVDSWAEVTFMPVVYRVSSGGTRINASAEILWYESFTTEGFGDGSGLVSVTLVNGSEMSKEFTYQISSIVFGLGLPDPADTALSESAASTEEAPETTD